MRPFSSFCACSYQVGEKASELTVQNKIKSSTRREFLLIAPVYEILFGLNFDGPLFILLIKDKASFQQPPDPQAEIAAE